MKTLLIVLVLVGAGACDEDKPAPTPKTNQAAFVHYYKDSRTGVCFAGSGPTHLDCDHSHLSALPCTDTIENLVEPWPKTDKTD